MFLTRCDVNALIILDNMFLTHSVDHFYKACRDNSIIIEIPGKMKNSFMNSMELEDNFDIRLIPYKKDYYVEARTKKGSKLINNLFKRTNKKIKINHPREQKTLKPSDLKKSLTLTNKNNAVWNKHAKNCLSCASCTVVCPTCTCFDIDDGFDINIDIGSRQRAWASCQILEFTEVAGGHIFRKERYKRVKHRVLHKFKYHKENFGKNMCVGCGRCITACPTDIDITQIVKELK